MKNIGVIAIALAAAGALTACAQPRFTDPPQLTAEPSVVEEYVQSVAAADLEGLRGATTFVDVQGHVLTTSQIPPECLSGDLASWAGADLENAGRSIDEYLYENVLADDGTNLGDIHIYVLEFEFADGSTIGRGIQWTGFDWRVQLSPEHC